MLGFRRHASRVIVIMGHPDYRDRRYINAPDMDAAVAWTMQLRTGAIHWKPKPPRAARKEIA